MTKLVFVQLFALIVHHESKLTPEDYKVSGLNKFGLVDDTYSGFLPINKQHISARLINN